MLRGEDIRGWLVLSWCVDDIFICRRIHLRLSTVLEEKGKKKILPMIFSYGHSNLSFWDLKIFAVGDKTGTIPVSRNLERFYKSLFLCFRNWTISYPCHLLSCLCPAGVNNEGKSPTSGFHFMYFQSLYGNNSGHAWTSSIVSRYERAQILTHAFYGNSSPRPCAREINWVSQPNRNVASGLFECWPAFVLEWFLAI